jgi:hypothetical protein
MSKRAGLHPKANSKTKSNISPLAKVQGLMLFGSAPLLLPGEDDAAYHELLSRVRTAISPVDIIDEMFHSRCGLLGMGGLALAPPKVEFDANART